MTDDLLLQVLKPARYIGEEWNVSRNDFEKAAVKFALCFPDLYEVGMSNLGLRILYGILNALPDVACERFFAPHLDMENALRSRDEEISSLESKRALKGFDFVGFSLGHELCYTNALNMLDLGHIPLQSRLRDSAYPLIIGGGPCVLNPEPLHEFFDLFVIGEGEEVIREIVDAYRAFKGQFKSGNKGKEELLIALSHIEGVYVPSLYSVAYTAQGKIAEFKPRFEGVPLKVKKRFVQDFNNAFFPVEWLTPYIQVVHDRITLEIMRGCPNCCRFCQARMQYYPLRMREPKTITELAVAAYNCSGYEEIALGGLSISDYPHLEEVIGSLIGIFKEKGVSVSFPSIKPKAMLGKLSSLIATIKKTGLTFAPEAATERLRRVIAKDFDMDDFQKTMEQVYRSGYQHVKLYFMVGLPSEEKSDLDGIFDFAVRVSELKRNINQRPAQVNISINTLIPKPHTPLQWLAMQGLEDMRNKHEYLKKQIAKNRRLRLSFHNIYMSFLEGILSRGDRRLSAVIANAFKRGARFDAWDDHFVFEYWMSAFSEAGIDPGFYLQEKPKGEALPWDFLDIGLSKEKLAAEFDKAIDIK